mgnify:CR=1 FL=1
MAGKPSRGPAGALLLLCVVPWLVYHYTDGRGLWTPTEDDLAYDHCTDDDHFYSRKSKLWRAQQAVCQRMLMCTDRTGHSGL